MSDLHFYGAARVNTGSNDGIYALNEEELDQMMEEAAREAEYAEQSSSSRVETIDTTAPGDRDECNLLEGNMPQTDLVSFPPYLCNHNCWDNLRTKKDLVTMRCRECSMQWKAMKDFVESHKCEDFTRSSCKNNCCEKLHIFRFKLPAKKRDKLLRKKALMQGFN
eukprot:TRINITY_DN1253_c2_g1_i1.p1 TRINITY_DN1253_c2_g1~~TRINITY_DN1253_c2_g1_i1.p1  ORF type:complete len:165 (+),score=27.66 TRINITY_DN1253_c2_g1_i1:85-579(+)